MDYSKYYKNKTSINFDTDVIVYIDNSPLYDGDPSHRDIVQGGVGSCWFLSVLISYLRPNKGKRLAERGEDIRKAIKKVGSREGGIILYSVDFDGKSYIVDNAYTYRPSKRSKCQWYRVYEKAMLSSMSDSYIVTPEKTLIVRNINVSKGELKTGALGINKLLFKKSSKPYVICSQNVSIKHRKTTAREVYRNFKLGRHIVANTYINTYPNSKYPSKCRVEDTDACPQHCYAIIDIVYRDNMYYLTVQNPWGKCELDGDIPEGFKAGEGVSVVSWDRFRYLFACIHF